MRRLLNNEISEQGYDNSFNLHQSSFGNSLDNDEYDLNTRTETQRNPNFPWRREDNIEYPTPISEFQKCNSTRSELVTKSDKSINCFMKVQFKMYMLFFSKITYVQEPEDLPLFMARLKKTATLPYFQIFSNQKSGGTNDTRMVGKLKCNILGNVYNIYESENRLQSDLSSPVYGAAGVVFFKGPKKPQVLLPSRDSNFCPNLDDKDISDSCFDQSMATNVDQGGCTANNWLHTISLYNQDYQAVKNAPLFQFKDDLCNNMSLISKEDAEPMYVMKRKKFGCQVRFQDPLTSFQSFCITLSLFHRYMCSN